MAQSEPMACPVCRDKVLASSKGPLGIELDRCAACGGLWLDRGEVFAFDPEKRERMNRLLADASEWNTPTDRLCPRCRRRMNKAPVGPRRILIELCGSCEGLWLDSGEIEALLSMLQDPPK